MKPKTVYAVTDGEYSDYRVLALFTTKKLADAHVEAAGGRVEPFLLFDHQPRKVTIYSISARIGPDGSVTGEFSRPTGEPEIRSRVEWEYGNYEGVPKPIMEARLLQAPYAGKDWIVRVSGTDKAKILKSFHDRVAEGKARTLGVSA